MKKNKKIKKTAVKVYGNSIAVVKFDPYNMAFRKMEFNGTREDKIKWLKHWFDEAAAVEITENSLTKFPMLMIN